MRANSVDDRFDEYFADSSSVRPPTVYLGFPCCKDTEWKKKYPGISNCILISDAKWEWFEVCHGCCARIGSVG